MSLPPDGQVALPPPRLKLDNTLGVMFIANIVAAVFYGLTTVQIYVYYQRSKHDPRLFKVLIAILWLLDTTHLALITHAIYTIAVTNYDNPKALLTTPVTVGVHIIIAGLSDIIVRGIYTYRIWRFSGRNIPLALIIGIIAFIAFLGSPALTAVVIKVLVISRFPHFAWLVYITFATGALADVSIATSLCFLLWRRRTGFKRTDSTINTLMVYTINTGALTSLFSIVCVITFATMPTNLVYLALLFILPKLLLNSLLANLNARPTLNNSNNNTTDLLSIHLTNVGTSSSRRPEVDIESTPGEPALQIKMETSTHQKTDSFRLQ